MQGLQAVTALSRSTLARLRRIGLPALLGVCGADALWAGELYAGINYGDSLVSVKQRYPSADLARLNPAWAKPEDALYKLAGAGIPGTIIIKFTDRRIGAREELNSLAEMKPACESPRLGPTPAPTQEWIDVLSPHEGGVCYDELYGWYKRDEQKNETTVSLADDNAFVVEWVRWIPDSPIPLKRLTASYGPFDKKGVDENGLEPFRRWTSRGATAYLDDSGGLVLRVDFDRPESWTTIYPPKSISKSRSRLTPKPKAAEQHPWNYVTPTPPGHPTAQRQGAGPESAGERSAASLIDQVGTPAGVEHQIDRWKEKIKTDPQNFEALLGIASGYGKLHRYQEALIYCKKAARVRPHDADVHLLLGTTYGFLRRDSEKIAEYKEAIRLRPTFAQAYARLATAYGVSGQYGEALQTARTAVSLDPRSVEGHVALGLALASVGRFDEANRERSLVATIDQEAATDLGERIREMQARSTGR